MEGATPHFPRDHFTRYTSPESLPAYHPPYGYLSPPYSSTRSPTTEVRLASSPAGLGISQCTFEPHYEHQRLHDADSARANLSFRTDQGFYRTGAMALPSQLVPRSPYTASPGCPSYYPTPRHRCPPAQPPHNTLVDFQREDTHSHLNFFNQPVHSSSENPVASNHIRYQTDPMQDGKWTVPTQRAVHSLPETRSDTLVWEHTALQHYAYSEHYMAQYASNDTTASTEPCPSSLPELPVSEAESHLHYEQVYFPLLQQPPSEIYRHPDVEPGTASPGLAPASPDLQAKPKITVRSKIAGRRTSRKANSRAALTCQYCSKTFPKQSKMREHEKLHEQEPTLVMCPFPECGSKYGRQADLARHHRSKHKNLRFPCKYCSKTFNRSDITRRHEEQSCRTFKAEQASQGSIKHEIRSKQ